MPVTIPRDLPAAEVLKQENIFFMTKEQAIHQDIRPLQVVLLNLMPNKIRTEQQFLRLLGNTALQVELTFLTTATYQSKHTPRSYLQTFYQTFDQIRDRCFDALIITGSPVETLAFEEVAYWQELTEILSWADAR
ncbi:MAG: homoserine O-succinyltransferase, partial [Sphaerochaeta sp.]|nr:homoserine O-succinyltransferase [Sphaerochaeta sp.]